MALTPRDIKDISNLVTAKLELYMNNERRQNRFDTKGYFTTTPKMHRYDFLYRVLDQTVFDKIAKDSAKTPEAGFEDKGSSASSSGRLPRKVGSGSAENPRRSKSPGSNGKKKRKIPSIDPPPIRRLKLHGAQTKKSAEQNKDDSDNFRKRPVIEPELELSPRRVILFREATSLVDSANKIYKDVPLEELQIVHRYRPSHVQTIPDVPVYGKVQGYSRHVGAILHGKKYVDFYIQNGLHTGDQEEKRRSRESDLSQVVTELSLHESTKAQSKRMRTSEGLTKAPPSTKHTVMSTLADTGHKKEKDKTKSSKQESVAEEQQKQTDQPTDVKEAKIEENALDEGAVIGPPLLSISNPQSATEELRICIGGKKKVVKANYETETVDSKNDIKTKKAEDDKALLEKEKHVHDETKEDNLDLDKVVKGGNDGETIQVHPVKDDTKRDKQKSVIEDNIIDVQPVETTNVRHQPLESENIREPEDPLKPKDESLLTEKTKEEESRPVLTEAFLAVKSEDTNQKNTQIAQQEEKEEERVTEHVPSVQEDGTLDTKTDSIDKVEQTEKGAIANEVPVNGVALKHETEKEPIEIKDVHVEEAISSKNRVAERENKVLERDNQIEKDENVTEEMQQDKINKANENPSIQIEETDQHEKEQKKEEGPKKEEMQKLKEDVREKEEGVINAAKSESIPIDKIEVESVSSSTSTSFGSLSDKNAKDNSSTENIPLQMTKLELAASESTGTSESKTDPTPLQNREDEHFRTTEQDAEIPTLQNEDENIREQSEKDNAGHPANSTSENIVKETDEMQNGVKFDKDRTIKEENEQQQSQEKTMDSFEVENKDTSVVTKDNIKTVTFAAKTSDQRGETGKDETSVATDDKESRERHPATATQIKQKVDQSLEREISDQTSIEQIKNKEQEEGERQSGAESDTSGKTSASEETNAKQETGQLEIQITAEEETSEQKQDQTVERQEVIEDGQDVRGKEKTDLEKGTITIEQESPSTGTPSHSPAENVAEIPPKPEITGQNDSFEIVPPKNENINTTDNASSADESKEPQRTEVQIEETKTDSDGAADQSNTADGEQSAAKTAEPDLDKEKEKKKETAEDKGDDSDDSHPPSLSSFSSSSSDDD